MKSSTLTLTVIVALAIGFAVGFLVRQTAPGPVAIQPRDVQSAIQSQSSTTSAPSAISDASSTNIRGFAAYTYIEGSGTSTSWVSATSAVPLANSANIPGWVVYTDPEHAFSIQYPNSLGTLYVNYGPLTERTLLNWSSLPDYSLTVTFIDPYAYSCWKVGDPLVTFQDWLAKFSPTNSSTQVITINGLTGVDEGSGLVYLEDNKDGYPHPVVYEVDLACTYDLDCTPPDFWRRMLESFETMQPTPL